MGKETVIVPVLLLDGQGPEADAVLRLLVTEGIACGITLVDTPGSTLIVGRKTYRGLESIRNYVSRSQRRVR